MEVNNGRDQRLSEEMIDATLADSFPASDPPSWTLGRDRNEQEEIAGVAVTQTSTINDKEKLIVKTNIDLSEEQRASVVKILNTLLSDEYLLYTKTRNYHWNVTGPQFNDLHKFFEAQYEALDEFIAMGGSGSGIPVEQDGGSGTAGSHWDEETFGNELMTGYINDGDNPFSAMSAAAFRDMGYVINLNYASWADPYSLA